MPDSRGFQVRLLAWLNAASARRARERQDRADFELGLETYNWRGYSKGAWGIYMCLITPPVVMTLKKVRRLMKKYGLQCPIRRANPYRKMKNAMKMNNYAPNLLDREFESYGPRLVRLTDITYIPWGGSFLYLCVIMDAYTKQVLSYALEVDFVLDAVDILIREHGVSLHTQTVIHSDQGCHYTSCKFIELVEHNDLRRSMSRKGNCWDNAPQESFFGHMKDLIDLTGDLSFDEVKAVIDDYMSYYNSERYQWDLAELSPNEYFSFVTTGIYPLDFPSKPSPPEIPKTPNELGAHALEQETVFDSLIR
ncbi:IS3 family transposase [Oscillospiraceae bacterium 50-58]